MKEVAQLLLECHLEEITLEATSGETPARLTLRRAAPVTYIAAPSEAEGALDSGEASLVEAAPPTSVNQVVSATAVGVFRAARPALNIGDTVKKKQLLGLVEALKIPNEVYALEPGTLMDILATDGQGVEWGQPLFVIEPAEKK